MATPTPGLAYVTPATPGDPIDALDANLEGGYILNPITAPGILNVDPTGPASVIANGTTSALSPGQTFYAIANSTMPVSVCSNLPNHTFVSVQWK